MGLRDIGEFGLIEALVKPLGSDDTSVTVGIGDDSAVLRPDPGRELLVTCDSHVEGVHFWRDRLSARDLGERIAAVNLSDIAAMGGQPRWAVSSIVVPENVDPDWLVEVYRGLHDGLSRFGARLVGGNTSAGATLVFDLTLIGEAESGRALTRRGARPGQMLCVTGTLGDSAAGLAVLSVGDAMGVPMAASEFVVRRHLTPTPRIEAGRSLLDCAAAGACIDVSDGLAGDAEHLCRQSGVSLCIDLDLLPISSHAFAVAEALGQSAQRWAMRGGEDYELLFTLDAQRGDLVSRLSQSLGIPITVIGEVLEGPSEVRWKRGTTPAFGEPGGFTHF